MLHLTEGLPLWKNVRAYAGYVALWPLVKLVERERQTTNLRREGYLRSNPKPRKLERRRRGQSLTIDQTARTPVPGNNHGSSLHPPRELRDTIWRYVVTGKVIHWIIEEKKLREEMCRMEATQWVSGCGRHRCQAYGWSQNVGKLQNGALGLVSSCHQIYRETIDILYSQNTFDVVDNDVMLLLPRLLLPQRVNTITTLRFSRVSQMPSFDATQNWRL
ncbi:hypothetical protein DL98DRAFT_524491 [Cadophora sp. DSE1049]|nr:hypothetical protein DL98DRAFT_524491 [Cadophora sp. DSE1049]